MTAQPGYDAKGKYTGIARRWFTQGWTGDTALAADIFSEHVTTNELQPPEPCALALRKRLSA